MDFKMITLIGGSLKGIWRGYENGRISDVENYGP